MVNEIVGKEFRQLRKGKMLNSGLERRIEKVIYVAVCVLYINVGYIFVVFANGMFVAVQSQYCLFGR